METVNVVSTPDITGIVSNCTSQALEVVTEGGIFTQQYTTIVTDSCTGYVMDYPTWQLTGISEFAIGCALIFGLIALIMWIATSLDRHNY